MKYTNEERMAVSRFASKIVGKFHEIDKSGRLLYLLVCQISAISKLKAYSVCNEHPFKVVKIDKHGK